MNSPPTALTVAELARRLAAELRGDASRIIRRVATLDQAGNDALAWLADAKYLAQFGRTRAAAVLVHAALDVPPHPDGRGGPALIAVADPDLALCDVLRWLTPPPPTVPVGIHASAVIEPDAQIASDAAIGPHAYVASGARVAARTQLHAGVYVGAETAVGSDCVLWPGVVVRERVTIGNRVIIHPSATIGADGFGYLQRAGRHIKIPQVGTVVIEDDVEIGANTAIDRARSGETRIGRGTKIDNLVQIAHNVTIGEDCVLAGQVGISGSVVLGRGVALGGQVGITDHVTVAPGVQAGARSLAFRDLEAGPAYMGYPAIDSREFWRNHTSVGRLTELRATVRALLKRVEQLESAADDRKGS